MSYLTNPYMVSAASTCTEQLLTGQTAAIEAPIYDSGQQVGQQFTSDEWFGLSQITKAQFSLKRAASVHSSLIIKCWLVNQADLDTSATIESFAKGQLGGTINVSTDVGTSFGFVTFEGSGLPDPTVDDDFLILEASGTFTAGDITLQSSDGSGGAIAGTRLVALSTGTFSGHANRNCVIKINCD